MNGRPTAILCEKFVVRPSGGSLYLGFRLITNFRLKAELRTSCFYTQSREWVDHSGAAYKESRPAPPPFFSLPRGARERDNKMERKALDLFVGWAWTIHP